MYISTFCTWISKEKYPCSQNAEVQVLNILELFMFLSLVYVWVRIIAKRGLETISQKKRLEFIISADFYCGGVKPRVIHHSIKGFSNVIVIPKGVVYPG